MSVTININGELILDQSSGLQDDDVEVNAAGSVLSGDLDSQFLTFLNGLGLSTTQAEFAADVEGASDAGLVTVDVTAGETIGKLFFSDASGNDFDGDLVPGVTTLDGSPLFFWSEMNGKVVLVKDGNGVVVAAFYIESTDATNTAAKVESITFQPLLHTDPENHDDSIDFSDVLRVSAVITQAVGDDIIVDDDGPTIVTSGNEPQLTTDDTDIVDQDSADFSVSFTPDFGTDGAGGITYALDTVGGASGLIATQLDEAINLVENGDVIEGRTAVTNALAFSVSVDANGVVTLTQNLAVRHDPEAGPDQSTTLAAGLISLTATITDFEGDHADATIDIGDNLTFKDDAPTIETQGVLPTVTVDESDLSDSETGDFSGNFLGDPGNDGLAAQGVTYALSVGVAATGLLDVSTNQAITATIIGGAIVGQNADGDTVFTISVDANGNVTLDQDRAVRHADPNNTDDTVQFGGGAVITLTATITDKDGDQDSADLDITQSFVFTDDAPQLTVPVDYPGADTFLKLGNAAGQSNTGSFGYDIGNDFRTDAQYALGATDFVGMTLTGSVTNGPFLSSNVVLADEDASSATFDWSFTFDTDPLTAGNQVGTASGTLIIDKDADTFTIDVDDPVEGFTFSVLHTNELLAKAPPGNAGHPELVVTELDVNNGTTDTNGFYVQFTSNSNPNGNPFGFNLTGDGAPQAGNTSFNAGEQITSNFEDWVSATQTTNGVAGDTIQKGELLTLRFFNENILGTVDPNAPGGGNELLTPTDSVNGIALKFDGIGNSEDLIMVLNLIDHDGADNILGNGDDNATTTKSIFVQNSDMIKGAVPAPYNSEFSLDNNDALVVIESNDYNFGSEDWEIQGVQIMQSGNGLTGTAINLNGAVGENGGSSGTQAWENTDNDVLKIVDIGFIETESGFQDASLDFSFNVADADGDLLGVQHINAQISNGFLI